MAKSNAKLYDPSLYRAAGINPCAAIDPKIVAAYESCADPVGLKRSLMGIISKNDEQIAINSFKWYGLPNGLTGNLIERILYLSIFLIIYLHLLIKELTPKKLMNIWIIFFTI